MSFPEHKLSATAKSWPRGLDHQCLSTSIKEYEDKMVLISGLSERTTTDGLWDYLQTTTRKVVERVVFLGEGKAIAELNNFSDLQRFVWTKLNGMQLTIERVHACNSVLATGLSSQTSENEILRYFNDVRRSGGGDVKSVKMFSGENHFAVVIFGNTQVADKVAGKKHSLNGKSFAVQKYFPQIDLSILPSADQLHKDIVSQFIVNGGYANELKTKLSPLMADIEWSPSSDVSKLWQIADLRYLNQWASSYQAVILEFLDRFQVFAVPVESVMVSAVDKALPRLAQLLPKKKALCKKSDSKSELLVACLKSERESVSKSVDGVLERIKKEIIKKETVPVSSREQMLLLNKTGFLEKVRGQYSEVKVTLNEEKCEIHFEGLRDQATEAKNECLRIVNAFMEEDYPLPYANIGKVVKSHQGEKYLLETMDRQNVSALFFPQKGNAVKLVAANSIEMDKAKTCLCDSMKWYKVLLDAENLFLLEDEKWKKVFAKLNQEQLLEISVDKSACSIVLLGISEKVTDAKTEVEHFIESEKVRSESIKLHIGLVRFLKEHFRERVKEIEENLKDSRVSVNILSSGKLLLLKGTPEGLTKCKALLDQLCNEVESVDEEFVLPGLPQLFDGETGRQHLRLLETQKKVVIEVTKTSAKGKRVAGKVNDHVKRERRVSDESQANLVDFKADGGTANACAYDSCNFTTKHGLKVSLKFGNIADEKADILVNSANSDLKHPTACGHALRERGGPSFVQACSYFSPLLKGDVVTTHGGNLDCKNVLHAVCCKWDNGRGNSEKTLRYLVSSILDLAVQLGASTVAMPAIGTREHEFPERVVLKVLREEIEKFSCLERSTKLKEIQIVVSAEETACQSSAVGFRSISFGSVNVSLHHGDITRHPVDAIINVLPVSLKLEKGGGVCKSILRAGGQDIQRKLNVLPGKPCPGSVVLTDAGSMSNIQNVLHVLPTSTDNPGFQNSIEQCFLKAKSHSLTSVSIPAIGTGGRRVSPRDSADIILGAAQKFANADYPLDVEIVVYQKSMIPSFETSIQEKTRANMALKTSSPTKSLIPDQTKSRPICLRSSKSRVEESLTLHFFAHSREDINISVEEVNKFVKDHIETRTIEIEKICHFLMKNYSEVEHLENVHEVSIICQPPSQVAISGLQSTVQACVADLLSLIENHGGKHQILRSLDLDISTCFQEKEKFVENEEAFEESSGENERYVQEFETSQLSSEASCFVPGDSSDFRTLPPPLPFQEMSKAVGTKWPRLARLFDIPESTVREIECNSIRYPDPRARARRVIELYLNKHHAGKLTASATNELVNGFNEIHVKLPECLLLSYSGTPLKSCMLSVNTGKLRAYQKPPFLSSADFAGTSMLDGSPQFLNTAKEELVLDSTLILSQREIERLSREIPTTWRQLAGLLDLPQADIENVERNSQCFNETDKAVKVLQLYNDSSSFNRSELGDFLEELMHSGLKEKIVKGTLRQKHYTQS